MEAPTSQHDDPAAEPAAEISLRDLRLLLDSESPDLADALLAFLEQDDPSPDGPVPAGALTIAEVKRAIESRSVSRKSKAKRREFSRQTWQRLLTQTQPPPPPRLALAELLTDLYQRNTPTARAALLQLIAGADLRYGVWGGLKRIYKLAEERLDAEIFGALACRFDTAPFQRRSRGEVGVGTLIYLRRRAWRHLRQIGQQLPVLYPQFAVQVLRHYDARTSFGLSWIVPRLWHGVFTFSGKRKPAETIKDRRFDDLWKVSPDPLMLLLETCQSDAAAFFAIHSLRRDFPDTLRHVTPTWLSRLAFRPLGSAHDFLIETLQASPEFHQSKLSGLGLHETILHLLLSPSQKARTYAIEYARAYAQDLPGERLFKLIEDGERDTRTFATALLTGRPPRDLGPAFLGRLLLLNDTRAFAKKSLAGAFTRQELPLEFLIDMLYGEDEQSSWAKDYIKSAYKGTEIGADFWKRVLADKRRDSGDEVVELALEQLGKFPLATLGAAWILDAFERDDSRDEVRRWLTEAKAPLPGLDVERLKGLLVHRKTRRDTLAVLVNTKLIRPRELGLPWLLALARRTDPELSTFAHQYLLQHLSPADFADNGDADAGTARLFSLATGDKEPEPVRLFAQTYLRCHHPTIGPEQSEAKALQLKPQLKRTVYTAERLWPALFDVRADVRRFAVAITRAELRRWGYHTRVYALADSDAKEVRTLGCDALLKAGDPTADPAITLTVDELDAAQVFALTESRKRTTREVGLELIRRHYGRLGGPQKLSWLMDSPDREVRLFAVRLLWEKHRPTHLPPGWRPAGVAIQTDAGATAAANGATNGAAAGAESGHAGRFADVDGLRDFLRRVLFGLPPGRSMEARDDSGPRRHIPASVSKRQVIEIVRDLGEEDAAFARLIAPVLEEFTGSLARTEWQTCLAALLRLRKVHPELAQAEAVRS